MRCSLPILAIVCQTVRVTSQLQMHIDGMLYPWWEYRRLQIQVSFSLTLDCLFLSLVVRRKVVQELVQGPYWDVTCNNQDMSEVIDISSICCVLGVFEGTRWKNVKYNKAQPCRSRQQIQK